MNSNSVNHNGKANRYGFGNNCRYTIRDRLDMDRWMMIGRYVVGM